MATAPTTDFNPFDPALHHDPYPAYRRLRDETPVAFSPAIHCFVVARHADVEALFLDPIGFSSAAMASTLGGEGGPRASERTGNVLQTTDPPAHDALRRIVNRGFTPRALAAMRPRVRAVVDAGIAELRGARAGEIVDLVPTLSARVPVVVIAELLGIERERHADFRRWSDAIAESIWARDGRSAARESAELGAYLDEVVARKQREPGEDVISKLIHAAEAGDGVLRPEEIPEFVTSLLVAGYETTANLISNCVLALVREAGLAAKVAADRSLVAAFVEETLRHDGPVQVLMRKTTREVSLGGIAIPAGAMVIPILGSANRDERRFEAPDRFDLDRPERGHLAFGQGVHFCLGAAIARAEAQEAVDGLLDVWGELEWLGDPYENVPALMMRGPRTLRFRRR
jgi:cytochrome P450